MRRILVWLVVGVLASVGLITPSATAATAATTMSGWTTVTSSAAVGYTFTVPVTVKSGTGFPTRTVEVQRAPYGAPAYLWATFVSGPTSKTGTYSAPLRVPAVGKWKFRLLVRATATSAAYTTAPRIINGIKGVPTSITGWSTTTVSATVGYSLRASVRVRSGTSYRTRGVELQRTSYGSGAWARVAAVTTSATGDAHITIPVSTQGKWLYRVVATPTPTYAAQNSASRVITGVPGLAGSITGWPTATLSTPAPTTVKATVTLKTGSTYVGRNLSLQRMPAGGSAWTTISSANTAANGSATISIPVTPGAFNYRLISPLTSTAAAFTSPVRTIIGIAAPTVTSVSPGSGTAAGGTEVTITGTNLTGATVVKFGATVAPRLKVVSASTITVLAPEGAPGSVDVRVTTPGGTSAASASGRFTYGPAATWRAPQIVDAYAGILKAVTCSSATSCAAFSTSGNVLRYNGTGWTKPVIVRPAVSLSEISCGSATFCLGLTAERTVRVYDGTAWSAAADPYPGVGIKQVWCSKGVRLCVGTLMGDDLVTYDGSTWSEPKTVSTGGIRSVSCSSEKFCVAVDSLAGAFTYDGAQWSERASVQQWGYLNRVFCWADSHCIASDTSEAFILSNGQWSEIARSPLSSVTALRCVNERYCVAIGSYGDASIFDGSHWSAPVHLEGTSSVFSLDCVSAAFCAIVEEHGRSSSVIGQEWTSTTNIAGQGQLESVSCPTATFCMAADGTPDGLRYDGTKWSAPTLSNADQRISKVTCTSSSFCVGIGQGKARIYNGATWSQPTVLTPFDDPIVSCSGPTMCMAVDSSTAWIFDGKSWSGPMQIAPDQLTGYIASISCPAARFCMAMSSLGSAFIYNGSTWVRHSNVIYKRFPAVSCTSSTFCVAASYTGDVVTFDGTSWSSPVALGPGVHYPTALSCTSTTFCALSTNGAAFTYNGIRWTGPTELGAEYVRGISCASRDFCAAFDYESVIQYQP